MRSPTVCRYCGGKIVKTNSRVLYGKGNQTIYLCTMCNAYAGCYAGTDKPMGKVANPVLRLKRQETHRVFDAYWRKRGWTRSGPTAGWHGSWAFQRKARISP